MRFRCTKLCVVRSRTYQDGRYESLTILYSTFKGIELTSVAKQPAPFVSVKCFLSSSPTLAGQVMMAQLQPDILSLEFHLSVDESRRFMEAVHARDLVSDWIWRRRHLNDLFRKQILMMNSLY